MRDEIIIFTSSFEIAFSVFIVSGVFEVYVFPRRSDDRQNSVSAFHLSFRKPKSTKLTISYCCNKMSLRIFDS